MVWHAAQHNMIKHRNSYFSLTYTVYGWFSASIVKQELSKIQTPYDFTFLLYLSRGFHSQIYLLVQVDSKVFILPLPRGRRKEGKMVCFLVVLAPFKIFLRNIYIPTQLMSTYIIWWIWKKKQRKKETGRSRHGVAVIIHVYLPFSRTQTGFWLPVEVKMFDPAEPHFSQVWSEKNYNLPYCVVFKLKCVNVCHRLSTRPRK